MIIPQNDSEKLGSLYHSNDRERKRDPWDKAAKQMLFRRDGNECYYCGSKKNLSLDHIVPLSAGGLDTAANLVTACRSCNSKKNGNALLRRFRRDTINEVRDRNTEHGICPDLVCTKVGREVGSKVGRGNGRMGNDTWGAFLDHESGLIVYGWTGAREPKYHKQKVSIKDYRYMTPSGHAAPGLMSAIDCYMMILLEKHESTPPVASTIKQYISRRDEAFKALCDSFGLEIIDRGTKDICLGHVMESWVSATHDKLPFCGKELLQNGFNQFMIDYRDATENDSKDQMRHMLYASIVDTVAGIKNGIPMDMKYGEY